MCGFRYRLDLHTGQTSAAALGWEGGLKESAERDWERDAPPASPCRCPVRLAFDMAALGEEVEVERRMGAGGWLEA